MPTQWKINILNGVEIEGKTEADWKARGTGTVKPNADERLLLGCLACCFPETQTGEETAEMLWPADRSTGGVGDRSTLQSHLRARLAAMGITEKIVVGRANTGVGLNPQCVTTDLQEFTEIMKKKTDQLSIEDLRRAIALYGRGNLLGRYGYYKPIIKVKGPESKIEDKVFGWVSTKKAEVDRLYCIALCQIVNVLTVEEDLEEALRCYNRLKAIQVEIVIAQPDWKGWCRTR